MQPADTDKARQAGAVEITEEMLEAGVSAFWDTRGHHAPDVDVREVVRAIFLAMHGYVE